MTAVLRALKVTSEAEAHARLEVHPELLRLAMDVLLIGVTDFFRDTDVFDTVQAHVLPALAGRPAPLRVWSAGCSTGAELHTLAILFAEAGMLDRVALVGTDCRRSAIEAARQGRYTPASLSGVPEALRDRYFAPDSPDGNDRQLAASIRARTEWHVRDMLFEGEPGPWDLVLCRNVAIYLAPDASLGLMNAAAAALAPGGFIVVGNAERLPAAAGLTPVARCVYRRDV